MTTKKEFVRQLLTERGSKGVSAYELTYAVKPGITRAAAIIFELRREGMNIETITKSGSSAVYYLRKGRAHEPPTTDQTTLFPDD